MALLWVNFSHYDTQGILVRKTYFSGRGCNVPSGGVNSLVLIKSLLVLQIAMNNFGGIFLLELLRH